MSKRRRNKPQVDGLVTVHEMWWYTRSILSRICPRKKAAPGKSFSCSLWSQDSRHESWRKGDTME